MAQPRITEKNICDQLRLVKKAFADATGCDVKVGLVIGDKKRNLPNTLVLTFHTLGGRRSTQVWPDSMAGYTKREAYNAMRLMSSSFNTAMDMA